MRNRFLTTETEQPESYRGIPILATRGLHLQAARLVRRYLPAGSTILDVGAGAGAFSRRLADEGFLVTAADSDRAAWQGGQIPFIALDLNESWLASVQDEYDGAACLEVIEHIENPRRFLRDVFRVVKPGGYMILSTPNITSFFSRALFLRRGTFQQFEKSDLNYGHINPMASLQLETAATDAGWEMLGIESGGYLPILDLSRFTRRTLLMNCLRLFAFLVARGRKRGWCLLIVLHRPSQ